MAVYTEDNLEFVGGGQKNWPARAQNVSAGKYETPQLILNQRRYDCFYKYPPSDTIIKTRVTII